MRRVLAEEPRMDFRRLELPLLRSVINLWEPDETIQDLPKYSDKCPVCGNGSPSDEDRLSAILTIYVDASGRELPIGYLVKVHGECFENCAATDEPDAVIW